MLKKYRIYLIIVYSLLITTISLSIIKTNYSITVPGPTTNLNKIINFNDKPYPSNIYSVSVVDYNNVSVMSYLIGKLNKKALVDKQNAYVDTSVSYQLSSGTIQKDVSINNALICGFTTANIPINYEFKGFIVHSLYGQAYKYFKVGDIITSYHNNILKENYGLSQAIFDYEEEDSLSLDKEYIITLIRDNETINVSSKPFIYQEDNFERVMLGLSMYAYYEIEDDNMDLYNINYPSTTGPSAGLAMALYVYDQLSNKNLTKDLKIVNTGTIDIDGTVGSIGGVEAKIISSYNAGATHFFVPIDNYEDALSIYNKLNTKMQLIPVTSIYDVIDYLESMR